MESDRSVIVTIYDRNLKRVGWVADYEWVSVTERWLAAGSGEIAVRADHPRLPDMLAPGAIVSVAYMTGAIALYSDGLGYPVLTGRLRDPRGSMLAGGTVVFQIEDEWRLLRNTLAWVVPKNPLVVGSLSDAGQSWDVGAAPASGEDAGRWGYTDFTPGADPVWPYGTVDTADKVAFFLIETNINRRWGARFGDVGRVRWSGAGGAPTLTSLPQVRFGTIEAIVVPLMEASDRGIRFQMRRFGDGVMYNRISAETWQPKRWPQTFTPDSGVIVDGEWSIASHSATDVVVGGPGDLTARTFKGYREGTGVSDAHRDIIEVFREATGAPVQWPTALAEAARIAKYYMLRPEITADQKAAFAAFLDAAAAKELADGVATSGVRVTLSETGTFRYAPDGAGGQPGFRTGDWLTVAPAAGTTLGLTFTERIMATTVSASKETGVTVTPQLGIRRDDPDVQLAQTIRNIALTMNRRASDQ